MIMGYIHIGAYGKGLNSNQDALCLHCNVNKRSVTSTGTRKSICNECARKYAKKHYAARKLKK